jgi:hypothetical protein
VAMSVRATPVLTGGPSSGPVMDMSPYIPAAAAVCFTQAGLSFEAERCRRCLAACMVWIDGPCTITS